MNGYRSALAGREGSAGEAREDRILLSVRDVKKHFPIRSGVLQRQVGSVKAVDGVSFDILRGRTLGLVGESGCGKTTVGRTILRLLDATAGSVVFDGIDLMKIQGKDLRNLRPRMQFIFQDPFSSLSPRMPVGEIIGEAVRQHRIVPRSEWRKHVLKTMDDCGLQKHQFDRYPHEFSGGQRQRICIARALALGPRFVVADEPVSALDVSIQAQIINLLMDLQDEHALTYLFISHDLSVVEHISDDVGVMYLGSMVEMAPKRALFDRPLHPYTQTLLSAVPVPDPTVRMNRVILQGDIPSPANPPPGCKFHTRCPYVMDICRSAVPVYREVEPGHHVACHLVDMQREEAEKARAVTGGD
ncbi:MAG: dipeptide ABC transporter ATP-binding protein [Clostridia bacterium]|nr:dipeptide ABC transporter ATP-binding protein [Clostridia bacterium]